MQQELDQMKQIKNTTKKATCTELQTVEEIVYKNSVHAMMDVTEKLFAYFKEGSRKFKRGVLDVASGKEEFAVRIYYYYSNSSRC